MSENEERGKPYSWEFEKLKPWMLEHLKDVEFGSAKHQAWMNQLEVSASFYKFTDTYELLEGIKKGELPDNRIRYESKLRILEMKQALLERDIDTKISTLPGYEDEYEVAEDAISTYILRLREETDNNPNYKPTLPKRPFPEFRDKLDEFYAEMQGYVSESSIKKRISSSQSEK